MSGFLYELEPTPLARGSQGEVYLGTRSDGKEVAIKVAGPGEGAAEAVRQEIALLRALNAQGVGGVVLCLDEIQVQRRPAMVMPRYPRHLGHWLQEAAQQPGPGTLDEILRTCAELAYVLGRVHETPLMGGTLVHRDIKPENILLDAEDRPFIGDFGGAMAIGGLQAVELALFGTPMWAPLDQILPGRAIPDPTWDTYALCVLLYAALTGARPAYQSDPRTLLTPAGVALWDAAKRAVEAPADRREIWSQRFAEMRRGTRAADLIDPIGHSALIDGDREALDQGVQHLCELAGVPPSTRPVLLRGIWNLLGRGLSPVSHPSPPNRYRSGLELGEALDDLRTLLQAPAQTPAPQPTWAELPFAPSQPPRRIQRSHASRALPALGLLLAALLCGGLYAAWEPITQLAGRLSAPWIQQPATVLIAGGPVPGLLGVQVDPFHLDRTEGTARAYRQCVSQRACPPIFQHLPDDWPAVALDLEAARAYCAWVGGRLPTEAEWRMAAGSGPWPWGDAPADCDRAIGLNCGDGPTRVGAASAGATPSGVVDMAGNVWEWTEEGRLFGGSARSPRSALGVQGILQPSEPAPSLAGVRCAYDSPPTSRRDPGDAAGPSG